MQLHVVYPMAIGKEMQFFGARANLAKSITIRTLKWWCRRNHRQQVGPEKDILKQRKV